mmetsp:Transcript_7260/g.8988  ORF Transcript_7260/g.8988 Transcript_7260/m.8988 type:complete len:118 (-) Transcript_7260:520-873(-)
MMLSITSNFTFLNLNETTFDAPARRFTSPVGVGRIPFVKKSTAVSTQRGEIPALGTTIIGVNLFGFLVGVELRLRDEVSEVRDPESFFKQLSAILRFGLLAHNTVSRVVIRRSLLRS